MVIPHTSRRDRIALVTYAELPELAPDDRLLAASLEARGIEPVAAVWDDPGVRWSEFGMVLLRSCWDYHLKPARFASWLSELERDGVRLWNPPATARWNMSKHYLRDLEAAGVDTVETAWIRHGARTSCQAILRERGWARAVIKPAVSATAHRTRLVSMSDAAQNEAFLQALADDSDVLIQPFLPEITRDGEWSLCFIDGEFSHAVSKRPRNGDFRVQAQHGGTTAACRPPEVARAAASRLMARLDPSWLYARVDGVVRENRFLLLELELLEPSLFLDTSQEGVARLADAIVRKMGSTAEAR